MLHPFYSLFACCLKEGEELQPHHIMKGATATQIHTISGGETPTTTLLGVIEWTDDGTTNKATEVKSLHKAINPDIGKQLRALLA